MSARRTTATLVLALAATACDFSRPRSEPPLQAAAVTERLGERVPPELRFRRVDGRRIRFGDLVRDARATVLVLAYFRCRTLCSLVLDGTAQALRASGLVPGSDVHVVTVSIDPRDTREDALAKRAHVLGRLGARTTADAWTFLLGEEDAIRALAEAVGFGYRYDADTDQYAHPAVVVVLTPEGTVSGYIYGIEPRPGAIAAAVRAAADGRTRATLDRVLLRCFRFIPAVRRHAGLITGLLWAGAMLTLAGLGALLASLWSKELGREAGR